jgi:predicted ATP-binding protein involved in virulence
LNPDTFAVANNITKCVGRMDDLSRFSKLGDSKPSNIPDKLTSLKNYKTFNEFFVTYLRQFRSVAARTPLSYIVRKDTTVTAEQRTTLLTMI